MFKAMNKNVMSPPSKERAHQNRKQLSALVGRLIEAWPERCGYIPNRELTCLGVVAI